MFNPLAYEPSLDDSIMGRLDNLLTVFSAEIEERDGTPVISLPEREIELGDLEVGETYRIAILPRDGGGSTGTARSGRPSRAPKGAEPPVEEGELCEVEIEDIGDQGDGIARVGPGYIVFVPDTKVGDRVTVEITQAQENFAFAEVVEPEPVSG